MMIFFFLDSVLILAILAFALALANQVRIVLHQLALDCIEVYFRAMQMRIDNDRQTLAMKDDHDLAMQQLRLHRRQLLAELGETNEI